MSDTMKNIGSKVVNVKRDMYGKLGATNTFKLFDSVPDDNKYLVISTQKSYKDIVTIAQVVYPTEYGYEFVMFQDFFKTYVKKPGRATAKAIAAQQEDALSLGMFRMIMEDAKLFYFAKEFADDAA